MWNTPASAMPCSLAISGATAVTAREEISRQR
jgi:hypothetical protein